MNIFKKKSLCAALAGIGALGAAGAAQAVNLNPDGLGQVLIYPYYTVRADGGRQRIQLAAVGRQLDGVGEGGQGPLPRRQEQPRSPRLQPVPVAEGRLDDAAIIPTGAGAGIITTDKSCTLPADSGGAARRS